MKKRLLLATVLALSGLLQTAQATPYTFDINNQGWLQSRIGGSPETLLSNTPADWTGSYGVGFPDGSIYQSSNGTSWNNRPYGMVIDGITPAGTLGDLTDTYLQAYIRSTANWQGRVPTDIVYARWVVTQQVTPSTYNMWVSKANVSIDLNEAAFGTGLDTQWIFKSIEMKESNFFKWPNASAPGTFSQALKNYTSFGIAILPSAAGSDALNNWNGQAGTFGPGNTLLHFGATATSGTATWGIDGFTATPIPEPAFFQMGVLASFGGIGLLRLRRRRL